MTASDKKAILKRLWPHAPGTLIDAIIEHGPAIAEKYELTTPLRQAHFKAQISHETAGGVVTVENMNYKTAKRIHDVWPSRFTVESAQAYVGNPRALANKVYNGRMGNRTGTDDGYNYRGRGLLQLTGRESYQRVGKSVGLALADDPDLVFKPPENSFAIAACEFRELKCLSAADADDVKLVTKRVNGGYIGLDDRKAWLAKWKPIFVPKMDLAA
jgi:putative chitinase